MTNTLLLTRREVLKAIDADLKAELKYCRDIIEDHPKNYQVLNIQDVP